MLWHMVVYTALTPELLVVRSAVWHGAGRVRPAPRVRVLPRAAKHRTALTTQTCARPQVQSLAVGVTSKESSAAGAARG